MILGAQFFTLRDYCKDLAGLEESMKKVADMGYKSIQLSGVCAYEGEWAGEKARENGLSIDITHYDPKKILTETEFVIKEHDAMNCKCIGIGCTPYERTVEGYEKMCRDFTPVAKQIAESGHKLMYHNHYWEFMKHEGKTMLDIICDALSPEYLGITFDAFWVQAAGADPVQWIKKLHGRIDRIHFKDMATDYSKDRPADFRRIAAIGEGLMNYDAIIQACLDTNVEIGYVELDDCYGEDPFDAMRRSYKFLNTRYGLM